MKLSALVLVKNEEKSISDCLKQLSFADEIVVLDQSSTDSTRKIAKKHSSRILESSSSDFSKNRNTLAENAKGDWLLYLDADERIDSDFIDELNNKIKNDEYSAYFVPRKNYVLGKRMKHGGWWPDFSPKLISKSKLIAWKGRVHESPQVKGEIGYFKSAITHLTAKNLNFMLTKSVKWAKVEANLNFENKAPKVTIAKVISAAAKEFVRRYVVNRGFMDGTLGLTQAIYQSLHQAIVLTYLWELQQNK